MRYAIPALVLGALIVLFAYGLQLDPTRVPSPLIDKPAPGFTLPALDGSGEKTLADLKGRTLLVNYWASWCPPCLQEHPTLLSLAQSGVTIIGIAYKDSPEDSRRWLAQHGNPFAWVASDLDGRAGLDWGVYGAPETYLLDGKGIIRHKLVGPMTMQIWKEQFVPLIKGAKG